MRLAWFSMATLFAIGCTASMKSEKLSDAQGWDGRVQQWGTLREVMHGEIMDGQVRLVEVTNRPHLYGIGAPDKLYGEILIADSAAWVTNVADGNSIESRRSDSPQDSAVFLAVAQVPRWTKVTVDRDVSADEFDDFIQVTIRRAGLKDLETIPFTIEGQFSSLDLHVLNGQCPFAEVKTKIEGAGPPHRTSLKNVAGLLVGFYSDSGAGRITHHWTRTHVHALVGTEDDRTNLRPVAAGHVDAVALKAGTILRVPLLRPQ
jgi:alpha-acetolactate decarboxylase